MVKAQNMKTFQVDVNYQSIAGNACSRRFIIKDLDEWSAIEKANSRAKKLKNCWTIHSGDCIEVIEKR